MATLAELAERAAERAGETPAAFHTQAVRDAVADFGYRVPRVLRGSLAIVAGTAAYALPAGFQRLIALDAAGGDGQRDGSGLLVAGSLYGSDETWTVTGGTITFDPTPGYTAARGLRYAAGYPYDADADTFTGLLPEHEPVVLMRAEAAVLRKAANASAGSAGLNYRIGDIAVSRANAPAYGSLAAELEKSYLEACRALVGFVGRRSAVQGWSYE